MQLVGFLMRRLILCMKFNISAWLDNIFLRSLAHSNVDISKMYGTLKVTAQLICAFVFVYADCWFSHEATHFVYEDRYISMVG